MTKADIVSEISKNTGIEKVSVQKIVEAVMDNILGSERYAAITAA